jgi:lipopolysaccharide export system protein LptA
VNWQKRARIAVAVIGLASAATVYFLLGKRLPPPVQVTEQARDPQATNETGPGDMTSLQSNGEPAWHVKFDRSSSYADGRMKFGKPHFVSPRGSQPLELWSDEAVAKKRVGAGSGSGDVDLTGHVVMQTASAWHIESDTATYEEATNLLRMPGAVTFSHDSMSGSSQGATYDRDTQVLILLADPHVTVKPDATGEGSLDASAVRMTIDRAAKYALLHEQARITRDKEIFAADDATLRLTEDEKTVRAVELRGRASVTPRPGADKPPPEMHADEIDLSMQPDGKALHTGALRRQASLILMGSAGANRIDGQTIGFGLAADGQTVSKLDASGRVALGLPRTADTGARSITAETLASTGDEKSGLKELKFDGAGGVVTFTEAQPAAGGTPASTRTGLSKLLTLNLDGDLGAITSAEFRREVKFTKDTDVSATADRAVYFEPKAGSTARLWLYQEGARALPRVVNADKGITIEAELVKIDIDSNDVDGSGIHQPVQTVSKPASDPAAAGPKPGLFASGQKIIGTGSAVTYRTKTDEATYTSTEKIHAMVQQEDGNNRISADKITVNKQTNDLTASGHVDSRFVSDPPPADGRGGTTPASGPQSLVRAAGMNYVDATRVAHYVGTKEEPAEITNQDGVTHAQKLDVFLDADGRTVKQLVADGMVYTLSGVREATGNHLVWIAAVGAVPDSYTITGRPVIVKEPKQPKPAPGKPDCNWARYSAGVTFSSGGDMHSLLGGPGQIDHEDLACSIEIPGKRGGL